MSHVAPGQLAAYNSLQDKHLSGYFNNTRMKKHLRKSGLINKKGKIIDEKTYRLNMAKKEHRKHVRDLLATAIIHKALDMERERQYEIRKRLDDIYKVELVRRVKVERGRKGDEHILPLLTPRERSARQRSRRHVRPSTAPAGSATYEHESGGAIHPSDIHYDDATGKLVYTIEDGQETAMNTYLKDDDDLNHGSPYTRAYPGTTYPVPVPPPSGTPRKTRPSTSTAVRRKTRPLRFHYLARTEPAVAHRVQLQSMAEVTMKFLGPSLTLSNSMFPEDRLSEVMVLQQHCGGSTLCVFRELLPPNTIFTFISRRHRGSPFGLTFYIDSMQDIRLSSCCEYKHKPEHILGGRNGHFQFVQVEGAAPCYRCQVASGVHSPKHKENGEQEEEEDGSKAFMTQDEDDNQSKQSFDVIITKVDPNANSDNQDKTADDSTQTSRDEKEDNEAVKCEEKESAEPSAMDEEKDEKYDDEKFEDEDDQEKEKEEKQEEENKEEDEKQTKTDDYNDDFDSEHEEPSKESDDEVETKDKNKEKKDRSDSSDSSSSSSSDSSDDSSDSSDEDDIQDDTEKKGEKEEQKETKEEEPEEVLDETEQNHVKEDKEKNPEVSEEEDNNDAPSNISNEVSSESVDKPSDVPEETVPETTEVTEEPTTGVSSKEPDEISLEAVDKHSEVPEESKPDTTEATEEPPTDNVDAGNVDVAEQKKDDDETRIDGDGIEEHEKKDEELKPVTDVEDSVDVRPDDSLEVVSPEPPDTADSSSDSSSSSSSDSDREDDKDEPDHDPGNDPDLVAGEKLPDQALKVIGVQPGEKHEGSIQPLVEGKKDIELTSLALDDEQIEELVGIIDKKDDVGSVTLRNTGITDSSIQQLVDVLKKSINVKMLNLNVNSIGPDGAVHIANLIKENKSLRMLLLHGNPIQDTGAHRILDAIIQTKDTSLTNLDLGDCQMGDAGATDIARLLLNNTTITDLTISGNSIGLSGWRIISSALEENTTLKALSLDFSNIRDEEAVIIAEGLRENKGLRSLDLEGNKIGDEGGKSLLDAIKVNTTMVDLTLMPMNEISKDIYHEIKAILDGRSKTPSRISSANGSIRSHQTTTEADDNGQESEEATKIDDTEQESTHQVQSTPDLIERINEVTQPDDVDTLQDSSPSSTQVPNKDSVEISQDPTQEPPSSAQVPNEDGIDTSQDPTQEPPSSAQVPNEDGVDTSQDPTQEPPSSIQVPNEQSVNPSQETTQEPSSSQPNEQSESERDDGDKVQNDFLLGNKQDV